MNTSPRIACARGASAAGSKPGWVRPRCVRIAALSVITLPSGSASVGICASGFTRCNSSSPGPGSHDAASTMRNGMFAIVSAASTEADPEPLLPYSVYTLSTALMQLRHAPLDLFRRHVLDVRGDRPDVTERIDERAAAIAVELVGHRFPFRSTRGQRLAEDAVDVLDVDHEPDGRAAECARSFVLFAGVGHHHR